MKCTIAVVLTVGWPGWIAGLAPGATATASANVNFSMTDTLHIIGDPIVDGLADARSLQIILPDEVVITESGADRIVTYQVRIQETEMSDGETHSGTGTEATEYLPDLDQPGALTVIVDTYFAVVNNGSGSVLMLDEKMGFLRNLSVPSWKLNGDAPAPTDITSTEIGELYLLDSGARRIYHFNANGSYLQYLDISSLERPASVMYAEESLFVTDSATGMIHVFTESGQELATIGRFPALSRVRVLDRNIWVLSGSVIHLFDIYGSHIGNWTLAGSDETIRDIAQIDDRLFILTPGSLYFSGVLQTR